MSIGNCPNCMLDNSIRRIFWGLPLEQPDLEIYTLGGCVVGPKMPEMKCIECGWQGSKIQVNKATRMRRFTWTDQDAPGITILKKFKITHEALEALENSKTWGNAQSFHSKYSPQSIYGPEGELNWLWDLSWDSLEDMRGDFYANMGGGVPHKIIDELIQIISSKTTKKLTSEIIKTLEFRNE